MSIIVYFWFASTWSALQEEAKPGFRKSQLAREALCSDLHNPSSGFAWVRLCLGRVFLWPSPGASQALDKGTKRATNGNAQDSQSLPLFCRESLERGPRTSLKSSGIYSGEKCFLVRHLKGHRETLAVLSIALSGSAIVLQNWVMESWSCLACAKSSAGNPLRNAMFYDFCLEGVWGLGAPKLEISQKYKKSSCVPAPLATPRHREREREREGVRVVIDKESKKEIERERDKKKRKIHRERG